MSAERGRERGFSGSIGPLCEALAATLSCGSSVEASVHVRVTLPGAGQLRRWSATSPSRSRAVACTPTPTPTATLTPTPSPTPTPAPTPIPDSDGDGTNDLADRCVDQAGWGVAPWFGGCPPPLAAKVAGALAGAGLLAFLGFYVAPMAMVMTVRQPPSGYVQVYRNGKAEGSYKSLRSLGQAARKSTITIGSKGLLQGARHGAGGAARRAPGGCVGGAARAERPAVVPDPGDPVDARTASGGNGIVLKFSTDPKQLG